MRTFLLAVIMVMVALCLIPLLALGFLFQWRAPLFFLGKGAINFAILFDYLKAERKEPPVITLEPHKEEDLWPSVEYLEKIWPW